MGHLDMSSINKFVCHRINSIGKKTQKKNQIEHLTVQENV